MAGNETGMPVSWEAIQWLLREMWLGCDGRWFLNVAERYGYDVANEMNELVGRSLARASMRRLLRATGWSRPEDIQGLRDIFASGYAVYHPSPECEVDFQVVDPGLLRALFFKCPVRERVEKGGGMDRYRCACPLSFEGWIQVLGLEGDARIVKGPRAGPPCEVAIRVRWKSRPAGPD